MRWRDEKEKCIDFAASTLLYMHFFIQNLI